MVGEVVSVTFTLCSDVALFSEASVAVQVTTVMPTGKPTGALLVTAGLASTVSETVGVPKPTADKTPLASCVMSVGAVMVGAMVSTTLTVNNELAVLLLLSVAEQLTVVLPKANSVPDTGAQVTATELSTKSVAVGKS